MLVMRVESPLLSPRSAFCGQQSIAVLAPLMARRAVDSVALRYIAAKRRLRAIFSLMRVFQRHAFAVAPARRACFDTFYAARQQRRYEWREVEGGCFVTTVCRAAAL